MVRSLRLMLGGICLLLAAALAVPTVRPAVVASVPSAHEVGASVDDAGATIVRLAPGADRVERARPLLLAMVVAAALLAAVGWVRTRTAARALLPVRADGRRTAPVRGPPTGSSPHR